MSVPRRCQECGWESPWRCNFGHDWVAEQRHHNRPCPECGYQKMTDEEFEAIVPEIKAKQKEWLTERNEIIEKLKKQ